VELGGTALTAHVTPGHTKGCTTWTMQVEDAGRRHDVVFACGSRTDERVPLVGNPKYPTIADDFTKSFQVLESLACDVFLGAHGYWFGIQEKVKRLRAGGGGNPFIDPDGYRRFVGEAKQAFLAQLKRDRAQASPAR
jgi:metallo-beta-lactamase class B